MREQLDGSKAVGRAVAACRPQGVCVSHVCKGCGLCVAECPCGSRAMIGEEGA